MPTVFAACIILLFTAWVWNLKHELDGVRKHQLGVAGGPSLASPGVVEQHHVVMAPLKRPVAHAAHQVAHATTTETVHPKGGVIPTWTIEG